MEGYVPSCFQVQQLASLSYFKVLHNIFIEKNVSAVKKRKSETSRIESLSSTIHRLFFVKLRERKEGVGVGRIKQEE